MQLLGSMQARFGSDALGWFITVVGWLCVVPAAGWVDASAVGGSIADALSKPIWQGIAGIAQLVAGIVAIRALQHARETVDQGRSLMMFAVEEARQARQAWIDEVAPRWQVLEPQLQYIELMNVGGGPALDMFVYFESQIGPKADIHPYRVPVVAPGEVKSFNIRWESGAFPALGRILIDADTTRGPRQYWRVLVAVPLLDTMSAEGMRPEPYIIAHTIEPGETVPLRHHGIPGVHGFRRGDSVFDDQAVE